MAATNTDMHMLQERPAAHHIPQHQPSSPSHSLSSPSLVESIRSLRDDSTRPHNVPATADEQHQIRARRKPVPSPLYPAGNNGLSYQQLSYQDSPRFDEPRSPREKLDALLAEEQHHTSPIRPTKPAHPPTPPNFPAPNFTQPSRPSAYAKLRQVSSPTLSSAGISPPASPVTMPPPSRPNRPETRPTVPVRNPSIDSAASSLSSTASQNRPPANHATRPSQDTSTANPPDMAALIATAGSPEAAMLALWKEKQNTSSHNAQLWRLVEKQRSMIIGLQKDLERALKDKDRYRRKFKEYAEQVPPGPGSLQKSDTFDSVVERETSQSPALSEPAGEPARPSDSKAGEHKTSPLTQEHPAPHLIPDSQLATSPSHSTASNLSSAVNSPTDYSVQPLSLGSKGLGLDATLLQPGDAVQPPEQASKPTTPPQNNSDVTIVPSDSQLQPPQISLIQATPVIGGDGFESPPRKTPQPLRKAPPAPLNLSKPITTSAHLHQAVHGDDVDSDYDDTLEVDEIPVVELRGRRKTREEDDRVREAMYSKDEEARSKSKKKKSESKSKQQATPSETPAGDQPQAVPVPLSPRQFNALQSGLPLSPRHPPANSLNALLSPANSDSSMMANRSVASPLMSPGLPSSPRPTDRPLGSPLPRNPKQSIASPPMSPTTTSQSAGRPVQQQVPLPPNTPQSYQSPPVNQSQHSNQLRQESSTGLLTVPGAQPSPESPSSSPTLNDVPDAEHVYRGLVSDQYPGLLLPPNALPSIQVKVFSSRLRPSRMSMLAPKPQEEDPVFILAVYARSDNKQLWRVEKTIATLPSLDSQLRSMCDFQGQLPDRGLFGGHAPAKIDARRVALNQYFDTVLETPMNEKTALIVCEYLSTDVIGAQAGDRLAPEPTPGPTVSVQRTQRKVGYLTKRGKNFGGWKARFFVLDGSEFRYFEGEGGAHLGTIKLQNAQIGKQSQQQSNQSPQRKDDSEDNQYRHAFLILEPKRKDSTSLVRHVLCAENDEERDAWVEALLQHVDIPDETSPIEIRVPSATRLQKQQASQDSTRSQRRDSPDVAEQDRLQGLSYDDAVQAQAPVRGPNHRDMMVEKASRGSPKESSFHQDNSGHYPAISGPSNGTPIKDSESWGSKLMAGPTAVKDKKRSIFGFRGRGGSSDLAPVQISTPLQSTTEHRLPPGRSVFGIPLMEAVEFTQPDGVNVAIPAVVYRCLEYLRAKKAISEEGIFRLSGSNIVIKGLRDRFNNEGDIKLLDGQYYDVHAVASLLKLYLRELPASVLTRELHLDFLKVLDMDERSKKIQSFNVLVHKLPRPNFELLRHLASFLIEIVDNSGVNKMTVRNVGIVFAPTLNIPAPLISFFLTDYTDIFGAALDEASSPIHEIRNNTSHLGDDAIRSPRRQMFSDLPTPAYNETTFQQRMDRPPQGYQGNSAPNYPPPQPPQQYQQQQQQQQQQQYSNQQQQGQYSGYDSGFIPMRPSYDTPAYDQPYNSGEGYGSLNGVVQSSGAREQRQRKRESGMLLMNMGMGGQRKGSGGPNAQQRGDGRYDPRMYSQNNTPNPLMVREETAFD